VFVCTSPEEAFFIEVQAVGSSARLHVSREFTLDAVFNNPVVRLVGKKDVSLGVTGRAFCEFKTFGHFYDLQVRIDNVTLLTSRKG